MFEETVKTKNGIEKRVIAQSQEELDEAVKAVKAEQSAEAPDIHNPKDGNKIVSPDNAHTEHAYVQPAEPEETPQEAPAEEKKAEPKKEEKPQPKAEALKSATNQKK